MSNNNNNTPRIPHRRLNRPEIYRQLERLQRKWNKLSYARFVIQAEAEMYPDHDNDPDNNFSIFESVRGFLTRIPLRSRPYQARQILDNLQRPDKYSISWANRERDRWNKDPAHHTTLIYRVPYIINEVHPATRRTPEYTVQVYHDYLQTPRGNFAVNQVGAHLASMVEGIDEAMARLESMRDVRRVVAGVRQVLEENERIQNGNGTI